MKEQGWIEPIVERVVGEVLDGRVAQLRSEIIRRVSEEIAAGAALAPTAESTPSGSSAVDLARGVAEIQTGSSQKEILKALLDVSSRHASRVALFVVKGVHASGWQARGFANSEAIKDFALDENSAGVSQAISERVAATVGKNELDARFLEAFSAPASDEARLCPLILKDKVAALIYADSGTEGGALDIGAIDLLVLSASAWLEVNSLRKQAQKEPTQAASTNETAAAESHMPAPVAQAAAAQAFNDPFAAHAPAFAASKAMAAAAAETVAPSVSSASAAASGQEDVSAGVSAPTMSPEDQETLRKAQRFARLLVDEIKLYNQAKVAEGKKNKDLYDRLKDTIEKSQATYLKRYGNTVAVSENYFRHEIIRSLAEDDVSIMGANFKH